MPDIVLPNTVLNDIPADAASVAENLFTPRASPNTLAGMNGYFDRDNLDPSVFPIGREMVRRGAYAGGGMSGATANQDFMSSWYRSSSAPLADIDTVGVAIPGATKTYRLRFPVTQVLISWQVGIIVDGPAGLGALPPFEKSPDAASTYATMRLYVDGFPVPRYTQGFKGSIFTLHDRQKAKYQYPNSPTQTDHRWWTCTALFQVGGHHSEGLPVGTIVPTGTGFHTAEIRIAHRGNLARCKTRNMSTRFNR